MIDMDRLLKDTFAEMVKEEYENRPEIGVEHKFSLKFHWKMRKVFRKLETRKRSRAKEKDDSLLELYRPVRSMKRRVAIALLVLMLVGGTAFATEPMIRWLCNFYVNQYDDHVEIQKNVEDTDDKERGTFRKYHLTEIPKGYTLKTEEFDEELQRYTITYNNAEGKVLFLQQTWQEDRIPENLTSDTELLEDIKVSGFTGYYVEDDGIGTVIFSNGVYKLVLGGLFSKEELIELTGKLELLDES